MNRNIPAPIDVRHVAESGALVQWWRELEARVRTRYDFDPLWRAACAEAAGRDFDRAGLFRIGDQCRRDAVACYRHLRAISSGSAPTAPFSNLRPSRARWSFIK